MQIVRYKDAPQYNGKDLRRCYLSSRDPFEVIETVMSPCSFQEPHAHKVVRESTLVLEGKVVVAEIIDGTRIKQVLEAGDFVIFDPQSCHVMDNPWGAPARTLTFKFLGVGKDTRLFAADKFKNCTDFIKSHESIVEQNTKYASYIEVYNNLDKLLWQVPAFLIAVSALSFGLLGTFMNNPAIKISPLSHGDTYGSTFLFLCALYCLGVFSIWRIRLHHTLMGKELAKIEDSGYFHERNRIVKKSYLSAPCWFMWTFSALALLSFAIGIYNILS